MHIAELPTTHALRLSHDEEAANTDVDDQPAVNHFGHTSWKKTPSFVVGELVASSNGGVVVEEASVSTREIGLRCHNLDHGATKVLPPTPTSSGYRPVDRDGKQRPIQPGEIPSEESTVWASAGRPWYVPFQVFPDLDGRPNLFSQWEKAVLNGINAHRIEDTEPLSDLAQAHTVLPYPGTRSFGKDLHLEVQTWLADQLTAEWDGDKALDKRKQATTTTSPSFLTLYTETIRSVIAPFMKRHYDTTKFHVQKHPKNLRFQMPGMKAVENWHCDRMFGHQREVNFVLCLTEFKATAGICMEVEPHVAHPILAGAGSLFSAPFGYKPHGNLVNVEEPGHTRVSLDWRVVPHNEMIALEDEDVVGASATSGLPYTEGAYFALWDSDLDDGKFGGWVVPPKHYQRDE